MIILLVLIIFNFVLCNEQTLKKSNKVLCKKDLQRATEGIKDSFRKTRKGINNVYQNTKKRIKNKKNKKDLVKNDAKIVLKEPEQVSVNLDKKWNYKDFYDTVFKYENTGDEKNIGPDAADQGVISSYNDIKNDISCKNVQKLVSSIDENKPSVIDFDIHTTDNQLAEEKILNNPSVDKSLQDIYKREFPNSYKNPDSSSSSTLPCKTKVIERFNDKKTTDNASFHDKINSNVKKRKGNSKNMKEISSVSKLTPGKRASFLADKVIYKDIDYSIEPSYVVPIRDHKFKEIRKTFQKETDYFKPSSSVFKSINFETRGNSTEKWDIKGNNYVQESSSTFEQSDVIVYKKTDKEIKNISCAKLSNTNNVLASVKILRQKFDNNTANLSNSKIPSINILSTIDEENIDVNFKSDDEKKYTLTSSAKSYEQTSNQDKDENISHKSISNSKVINVVSTLTEIEIKDGFLKKDENSSSANLSDIIDVNSPNKNTDEENFRKTKMTSSATKTSNYKFEEEQIVNSNKNNIASFNRSLVLRNRLDPAITEDLIGDNGFDKNYDINEIVNSFEDKFKLIIFDENAHFVSKRSEDFYSNDSMNEIKNEESSTNTALKDVKKIGGWYKQVIFWVIVGVTVLCFSFSVFILIAFK